MLALSLPQFRQFVENAEDETLDGWMNKVRAFINYLETGCEDGNAEHN